jgi:hypothetical protein
LFVCLFVCFIKEQGIGHVVDWLSDTKICSLYFRQLSWGGYFGA